MGAHISKELEKQLLQLDEEGVKQLEAFVTNLIAQRDEAKTEKKAKQLLEDMEPMPLSLKNDFANRARIYEHPRT